MKQFIVDRHTTPNTPTLEQVPTEKIPIYEDMDAAAADLANLAEGQIVATHDTGSELSAPVDTVQSGNMHAVTSNAVAEYLNNQNVLSDWQDFYLYNQNSWTMNPAPYDGKVIATSELRNDPEIEIKINDVQTAYTGLIASGVQISIGEVSFRKGDKVQVARNPSKAMVCFYHLRDYSQRQ